MITEDRVKKALNLLERDSFVRVYVEAAEQVTDAPLAFHVGAALSLLAQTTDVNLAAKLGTKIYSNCFVLIVGASGSSRKSTVIGIGRDLIHEAFGADAVIETPGSVEGLLDGLRVAARQLVCYEEFGVFLSQSEHSYLTSLRTMYTNLWDGTPVGRMLKGGRSKPIEKPRVSILAGVTVAYLEEHTMEVDWEGGFMGRFLTLFADRERDKKSAGAHLPNEKWLIDRLKALRDDANDADGKAGEWLGPDDEVMTMTDDWSELKDQISENAPRGAMSAIARALPQAYKIAMLLTWDRGRARSTPWKFHARDFAFALEVATWHAESAVRVTKNLASSPAMRDRRAVLNAISYHGTTYADVISKSRMLSDRVKMITQSLIAEEMITVSIVNAAPFYKRTDKCYALEGPGDLPRAELSLTLIVDPDDSLDD